jgi:hypothetical protein
VLPVPPTVTTQPLPVTVDAGGAAAFTVTAISSPQPTSYIWYRDNGVSTVAVGSGSPALNIAAVTPDDSGEYFVIVVNGAGYMDTSDRAMLTVTVLPAPALMSPVDGTIRALPIAFGGMSRWVISMRRYQLLLIFQTPCSTPR